MKPKLELRRKHVAFFAFVAVFFVYTGVASAQVSHPASEIQPGTFAGGGNYIFPTDSMVGIGIEPSNYLHMQINIDEGRGITLENTNPQGFATILLKNDVNSFGLSKAGTNNKYGISSDAIIYNSDNTNIRFYTNNQEYVRITNNGNVGIGTTEPATKLQINSQPASPSLSAENGMFMLGSATNNVVLESGMFSESPWGMWLQSKKPSEDTAYPLILNPLGGNVGIGTDSPNTKLVVTEATDNDAVIIIDSGQSNPQYSAIDFADRGTREWGIGKDESNNFYIDEYGVGRVLTISSSDVYSAIAMGTHATASGNYAIAIGHLSEATGYSSAAMGFSTTASGQYSMAIGSNTVATDYGSTAMGSSTTASGISSTSMGILTTASGPYSTAMGHNTEASGPYSTAMGSSTTASGISSTSMGHNTEASGTCSTVMGRGIKANGDFSVAIALSDQDGLIISQPNTMAIMGGNVGIGTATPKGHLDIAGGVSIGNYAGVNAAPINGVIISGDVGIGVNDPGNFKLNVLGSVSGIRSESGGESILAIANGAGVAGHFESNSGPAGYFSSVSGYGLVVSHGNVGIGTTTPNVALEVVGDVKADVFCIGADCKTSWAGERNNDNCQWIDVPEDSTYQFTCPDNTYIAGLESEGGGGGGGNEYWHPTKYWCCEVQ